MKKEMFIGIKNWKKYQADFKGSREWIKDYIHKESDREYCQLKAIQRYFYDALRRMRGMGKLPPLDLDFLARKMDLAKDDRIQLGRAIERMVQLKLVYLSYSNEQDQLVPDEGITHELFLVQRGTQPTHFKAANDARKAAARGGTTGPVLGDTSATTSATLQHTLQPHLSPCFSHTSANTPATTQPTPSTETLTKSTETAGEAFDKREEKRRTNVLEGVIEKRKEETEDEETFVKDSFPTLNGNESVSVVKKLISVSSPFDPLNYKQPVGDFSGDEVHRVLFYQWRVNENDYWRTNGRVTSVRRLEQAFPAMQRQTPDDFAVPGWATQPKRIWDRDCEKCHGDGHTLVNHPSYRPGMYLLAVDCDCVVYQEPIMKWNTGL